MIFVRQNLHKIREILNDILGLGLVGETLTRDNGSPYGLAWSNGRDDRVDHGNLVGFQGLNSEVEQGLFVAQPTESIDLGAL